MRRILASAVALTFLGLGSMSFAADGAEVWGKKCANCHGKDGAGKTKMGEKLKIKDLKGAKYTEADGIKATTEGVKDKDSGKEKMPAYKGKLSDDEIKAVVKYAMETFK